MTQTPPVTSTKSRKLYHSVLHGKKRQVSLCEYLISRSARLSLLSGQTLLFSHLHNKGNFEMGWTFSTIYKCTLSEDLDQPAHPRSLISLCWAFCG